MSCRLGFILLIAVVGLACSDRDLSREHAANLIQTVEGFKRQPHFWIRTEMPFRSIFKCETQADVERAPLNQLVVKLGWVRYETRSAVVGFDKKVECPAMTLTSAGKAASAKWERGRGAMGGETSWAVPIGRRELVQVTGISPAPDGSRVVEYEWRWVADETGTLLRQTVPAANSFFDQARKARATCRRWDDGWRCQLGMWTTAADGLGEFSPR
jgi:hypothetical protein